MAGTASSRHSSSNTVAQAARAAIAGAGGAQDILHTPLDVSADPAQAHAELENARQQFDEQAKLISTEKRRMEANVREYYAAHGIVPHVIEPTVLKDLRVGGRVVGRELAGNEQPAASGFIPQPVYSSPGGNLRAAEQIAIELDALKGDELRERMRRMRELLEVAAWQQATT